MKTSINQTKDVDQKFENYPSHVISKMQALRQLVIDCANELEISEIEETLKWGEPSYIAPKGSTLRMDWKAKTPDQYALYFKCTSKLIESIRAVYGDSFSYEKNRAILFTFDQKLPKRKLKKCISAALTYHEVKKLPLLGL